MRNIIVFSPMYTEDSNNLKKASLNSPYELNRFNAQWKVPEEFRTDVIAVYGEDIYAEIVARQCGLTLTNRMMTGWPMFQKNLPEGNFLRPTERIYTPGKYFH